jgi:hypothetical protein
VLSDLNSCKKKCVHEINRELAVHDEFRTLVPQLGDWFFLCILKKQGSVPSKLMRLGSFCKHSTTFSRNDEQFSGVPFFFGRYNSETRYTWSRDSAVGIPTGYRLDKRGAGARVPVWLWIFSSPSCPDPPSYPMGTGGSFPGDKAAGTWSWPLTSN